MITMKQILVLRDMGDGAFTDLIIFENEVDMEAVREKVKEFWGRDNWTYDDLLNELDNFGEYSVIPLSAIEIIEY